VRFVRIVGTAVVLCVIASSASAAKGSFSTANEAYQAGDYREAIRQYEALVEAGVRHEDLYYNLGNAYFRRAGEADDMLGRAIYNYERALRVAPDLADAAFNLEVAREAVAVKVTDRLKAAEGDPFWVRVVTQFSIAQLTVSCLLLNAVFFGALIVLRFLPAGFGRTGVIVGAAFVGIAELAVAVLLLGHIYFRNSVDLAIVLPDEIPLREGPDRARRDRGQVHAGLRVYVVGRDHRWVRVRLANGHEGWLPEEAIGEL